MTPMDILCRLIRDGFEFMPVLYYKKICLTLILKDSISNFLL
ncbi:hypothetical protein LEP1GSC125_1467 [Leptospira mayottensis 200901122]|uniref:Uncharacterized protein n=1 Tax=Leptospira mayottensis 200901122 TaxID=1193010 RepID=A0AA87MR14_9LEPT|nr:hypothetical protein LEP1GSC125_1467 [Leptospira mayottensis 200901122]